MGRHGPLTSLALGRSPYDWVVQGDGESDDRAPLQMYDERGRPTNPDTKRINRDIIRSHNEVMLVIGVAEPENSISQAEAEAARKLRDYEEYEDQTGFLLRWNCKIFEGVRTWLTTGLRQRIMIYKSYSAVSFYDLFSHHRTQQTWRSYLLVGLPSSLLSVVIRQMNDRSLPWNTGWTHRLVRSVSTYLMLHLDVYIFLQRTGVVPASPWLPDWRFFIPGTSVSPIFAPTAVSPTFAPPLLQYLLPGSSDFTSRGTLRWLGALAIGAAPFACLYVTKVLWTMTTNEISRRVYPYIPKPTQPKNRRALRDAAALRATGSQGQGPAVADSATIIPGGLFPVPDQQQQQTPARNAHDITRDETLFRHTTTTTGSVGGGGQPSTTPPHPPPPPHVPLAEHEPIPRRQSILSARGVGGGGDEFDSEDEDLGTQGATFISFDVEATESTANAPQGVWSAELRPNVAEGRGGSGGDGAGGAGGAGGGGGPIEPAYRVNALTRLPAQLATELLSTGGATLVVQPLQGLVYRVIAQVWLERAARMRGRPAAAAAAQMVGTMLLPPGMLPWGCLANLLGVSLVEMLLDAEMWATFTLVAKSFMISNETWVEFQALMGGGDA